MNDTPDITVPKLVHHRDCNVFSKGTAAECNCNAAKMFTTIDTDTLIERLEECSENWNSMASLSYPEMLELRKLIFQAGEALRTLTAERDALRTTVNMQDDLLNQHSERLEKAEDTYRRTCREKVVQYQRAEKAESQLEQHQWQLSKAMWLRDGLQSHEHPSTLPHWLTSTPPETSE